MYGKYKARTKYGRRLDRGYNRYTKIRNTELSIAKKALRLAKQTKRLMNVEYKTHDSGVAGNMTTTWQQEPITQVPLGDTSITRDGNTCKMLSIRQSMYITPIAAADDSLVRIALVKDTKNQGAAPTGTDVWDTNTLNSFPNIHNVTRFIILYDKIISFGGSLDKSVVHKYFKSEACKLYFTGAAGVDTTKCHYYFFYISNRASDFPVINMKTRIRFVDN